MFYLLATAVVVLISPPAQTDTVVRILDGDTIITRENGQEQRVRLACIDAPEMKDEPYGLQSKQALVGMIPPGTEVRLEVKGKDRYGRTVAELFMKNKNVGMLIVPKRLAKIWPKYAYQCSWTAK